MTILEADLTSPEQKRLEAEIKLLEDEMQIAKDSFDQDDEYQLNSSIDEEVEELNRLLQEETIQPLVEEMQQEETALVDETRDILMKSALPTRTKQSHDVKRLASMFETPLTTSVTTPASSRRVTLQPFVGDAETRVAVDEDASFSIDGAEVLFDKSPFASNRVGSVKTIMHRRETSPLSTMNSLLETSSVHPTTSTALHFTSTMAQESFPTLPKPPVPPTETPSFGKVRDKSAGRNVMQQKVTVSNDDFINQQRRALVQGLKLRLHIEGDFDASTPSSVVEDNSSLRCGHPTELPDSNPILISETRHNIDEDRYHTSTKQHDEESSPIYMHRTGATTLDTSTSCHLDLPTARSFDDDSRAPSVTCEYDKSRDKTLFSHLMNQIKDCCCCTSVWLFVAMVINAVQHIIYPSLRNYILGCVDEWLQMIKLFPSAATMVLSWTVAMNRGIGVALVSLVVSMITELSTTAPTFNCALALLFLFIQVKPQASESQYYDLILIVMVVFSIGIDLNWLSSRYLPEPLAGVEEGNWFDFRMEREDSSLQSIAYYGLGFNMLLKAAALDQCLKSSPRGRARQKCLECMKVIVIPTVSENLHQAIRAKFIAIAWVELVCCVSLFFCFGFAEADGPTASLFQTGTNQLLSLQGMLLFKGTSGSFAFLVMLHNIRIKEFCSQFGCSNVCPMLLDGDTTTRRDRRLASSITKSFKYILLTKLADFTAGSLLWRSLALVYKETSVDVPKETSATLILVLFTQMLTTLFVPILGMVLAW